MILLHNLEHRAQSALEKQQQVPKAAPRFATIEQELDEVKKRFPDLEQTSAKKDDDLLNRLKQVNIDSIGPPPEIKSKVVAGRPLPENRVKVEDLEFGYLEPTNLPEGKISIKQALELLAKHQEQPAVYTSDLISKEYKLDKKNVDSIVKYFRAFNLYVPKKGSVKSGSALSPGEEQRQLQGGPETKSS